MNRIDRLQAIITQLQSKKIVKASEIAERFDISLRTVYRDIRALEEAGVPIGAEAGVGYYLADGYHLPPISFTEEEASSLIISHQLVEKWGDETLYNQHSDAVYKIKSVLRSEQKDALEKLEQRVLTKWYFPMPRKQPSLHFDKIQSALVNNYLLSVKYFSGYRQEFTERNIESIGICFYGNHWHLIGYCHFRKDYRDFRLDRMEKVKVLTQKFHRNDRKSLQDYLEELKARTEIRLVNLNLEKGVMKYIEDIKYNMGLVEENEYPDYFRLTFGVTDMPFFTRWILILGSSVIEIHPTEVKSEVIKLVNELSARYLTKNQALN